MPTAFTRGAGSALALGWARITAFLDPYFEYVSMLLPGNGTNGAQNNTFLDSSTNNLSGKAEGLRFISGAVITSTTVSLTTATLGQSLKFDIRVGTSYDTSTIILSDELLPSVKTKLLTTVISVPSNNSLYVDIIQVGTINTGRGFGLQFTYFAGL